MKPGAEYGMFRPPFFSSIAQLIYWNQFSNTNRIRIWISQTDMVSFSSLYWTRINDKSIFIVTQQQPIVTWSPGTESLRLGACLHMFFYVLRTIIETRKYIKCFKCVQMVVEQNLGNDNVIYTNQYRFRHGCNSKPMATEFFKVWDCLYSFDGRFVLFAIARYL